jgi:hypothetical protein
LDALEQRRIARPGGGSAVAVIAPVNVAGEDSVAALGLAPPHGVVVLNGGTDLLPPEVRATLHGSFAGLVRAAVDEAVAIVTGGTDAGVFSALGDVLGETPPPVCVGVAPAGLVGFDGEPEQGRVRLEPHHTHFLLVEADEWGAEVHAMMGLADALARRAPSLAVVAGGGEGARREVVEHGLAGREVVVLAGTGRLADELAAGESAGVTVLDAGGDPDALGELVRERLAASGGLP